MEIDELIKEAKQGSVAAHRLLFEHFSPVMLMLCRRYVKNTQDAEELMLTGFYKFFKSIGTFQYKGNGAALAWLKKIMVNECLMHLRKKNAFNILSEDAADENIFTEDALDNLSTVEIFNMIIQLPVGYRTVFNLYVIEGMGHGEIAELLNISTGTSKSQLFKAKSLLQKMLIAKGSEYVKLRRK